MIINLFYLKMNIKSIVDNPRFKLKTARRDKSSEPLRFRAL